jgi:ribosomal protein L39E
MTVLMSNKKVFFRLAGIQCPHSKKQPFGEKKRMMRELSNRNVPMTIAKGLQKQCMQDRNPKDFTNETVWTQQDCRICLMPLNAYVPLIAPISFSIFQP